MQATRFTFALVCLLGTLATQTVAVNATGALTCVATSTANGTTTQSLPPGSPLPNGTTISTQTMSSATIGLALNVSATVRARYSIAESSFAFHFWTTPPYDNGSSSTACGTVLAVSASQPMSALLRVTWTHSVDGPLNGSTSAAIDIGNDGVREWQANDSSPSPMQTTFVLALGPTPTLIGTQSGTAAYATYPFIGTTSSSQLVLDIEARPPRCTASSYATPCGLSLSMTDAGGGILTFAPTLGNPAPGNPIALALGLQPQATPLPFGSNCMLVVVPLATALSLTGPSPPSWTLDGSAPIGPYTFDVQVLHLDAGQLLGSNGLQVSCQ
jgi:hypothetical protein